MKNYYTQCLDKTSDLSIELSLVLRSNDIKLILKTKQDFDDSIGELLRLKKLISDDVIIKNEQKRLNDEKIY